MDTGIAGSWFSASNCLRSLRVFFVVPQPKIAICWPSPRLFEGWSYIDHRSEGEVRPMSVAGPSVAGLGVCVPGLRRDSRGPSRLLRPAIPFTPSDAGTEGAFLLA